MTPRGVLKFSVCTIIALLGSSLLMAARPICSRNYSVWCHTYWFGYTQCAIFDQNGNYVREIAPGDASAWCAALD